MMSDTDAGTKSWPQGTVAFASDGAGAFTGNPCTLAQVGSTSTSSCTVVFAPGVFHGGADQITASYTASDSVHADSADATGVSLTVTKRSTSTSVTGCSPASVAINQGSTCTVVVSDTDAGTKSWPQGTVTFASDGGGAFTGNPCTLAQVGSTSTSSCTVVFAPSVFHGGADQITASYTANDSVHADSADATGVSLTVTKRSTS